MGAAPDAGNLAAHPRSREDLPGVASAGRVEGEAEQLHGVQIVGAEHARQVAGLVHPDAVLAGDRAAVGDALVEDGAGQHLGRGRLLRACVVEEHERVQVAVAGVEHIRDSDAGLYGQLADPIEHLGQRGARPAAPPSPVFSNAASSVVTPCGIGVSLTMILVAMPSVPSEPVNAPTRSYPGAAPVPSPSQVSSPSGVTISSPVTWCTVNPCFRQCAPPEFSATLPPTEQICWLEGSGA